MKLLDVVTVVFIILKWLNLIDWSWWTVLSPQWISLLLYLTLLLIGAAIKNSEKVVDK